MKMQAQPKTIEWFEIIVDDLPRAVPFYAHIFQVPLSISIHDKMEMAVFPYAENTAGGALVSSQSYPCQTPKSGTKLMIYLGVKTINDALKRVEEVGGKVAFPCTSIGENGFIAGFYDLEENLICLHAWRE